MEIANQLETVIRYNGVNLPLPDQSMSIAAAKTFYATIYPELTNAETLSPIVENDLLIYEFKRSVGTKG